MKTTQKISLLMLLCIIFASTKLYAQMTHTKADHVMVKPADVKWVDAPPSLPAGAKVAVIEGDPKSGGAFTMRIKFPANYMIAPHWHPADEHVTVLEGSFYMGLGEKYDEKTAQELPASGFAVMNTGTRHFAFTRNGCIVQVHGVGPWGITYVNPSDDPRNKQ